MRSSRTILISAVVVASGLVAGAAGAADAVKTAVLSDRALSSFQPSVANDRGIRLGSIGSGLFRSREDDPNVFWMVTDRGPNGQPGGRRTFPVADFTPSIVKVRVKGERIEILERIPLVNSAGDPITGLPNLSVVTSPVSPTAPAADEVPYAYDGSTPLGTYDLGGLDTEDIVRTDDGDFWLVDEYRPSLVHVSESGRIIERLVPEGTAAQMTGSTYPVADGIPAEYAYRRANRGLEGLALSPSGRVMVAALQSPLQLPPSTTVGRDSRNTRLLTFDADGNVTGEYIYRFDIASTFDATPGTRARDMKISGLYAISETQILVLERTDFVAKVYLVDLSLATNILNRPADSPLNFIESLNADGALEGAGITPLAKSLVVDLDTVPGMPDKIEGIAVVNRSTLAVANDNDFGLVDEHVFDANGNLANDTGATSKIIYVSLDQPLPMRRSRHEG